MRIESLFIQGFRCFSAAGQSIKLDGLTCLVGPNASGKTAAMAALARMFGETQADRTMRSSDFHLGPGEKLDKERDRHLMIEVKLVFLELDGEPASLNAIPEAFNQMVVDVPQGTPYCRIRLEATWSGDGTASGDIQQGLWWILTSSDDPKAIEGSRKAVRATERSRIRVVYLSATRDPSAQIRSTTASAFGRLLRGIDWAGKDEQVRQRLADLNSDLGQLPGIGTMNTKVQDAWRSIYDGRVASNITFESIDPDPSALLDLLAPAFAPDEQGRSVRYTELSDGLRSLFALSLPLGLYRVEELLKTKAPGFGFQASIADDVPLLTLFAVEEPENHLSPHYLGKIMAQLQEVANYPAAQVILSSHSPSIMARVVPDAVRYFLGGETRPCTDVRPLSLPTDNTDEAFKYVREAVRGHPELYFARLVILGEGPSEEIILRKLFESSGTPLDAYFVSVVPLGGRHVNHFWRLLHGLGIPYITLLDLDQEKLGAGWGRIQYVRDQLIALHGPDSDLLKDGKDSLADSACEKALQAKDDQRDHHDLQHWTAYLRVRFDVFFSEPLDIDLAMLEHFPKAYQAQAPSSGGPKVPALEEDRLTFAKQRMRQVLSADPTNAPPNLGTTYQDSQVALFPWYKYLFVDGSKPVAHMRALAALDGTPWAAAAPQPLQLLLARARELVVAQQKTP
jgi:hypothetical protein